MAMAHKPPFEQNSFHEVLELDLLNSSLTGSALLLLTVNAKREGGLPE